MSMRKPSTAAAPPAPQGAKRSAIELDKMKYDLLQGIPKQSIVTMTNANGGEVYEGQVDGKNKRHGKGTLRWPNGNMYFGMWADSSMCGQGTFLYAVENDTYKGEFKDDKKHGVGRYDFSNGNFYEGSFAQDKRHGRGRYSWTCGDSYEGEWCEGHMQGKGTTVYSNGNRYDGEFMTDRREGKGKLVCADGLSYDGQWLKNMRHGRGRLQFPNGDFYDGDWENDKKHGHGTDCFVNGNKFVGQYRDNVKHGHGVMTYANGDKYTGEWKGDKMDGQGRYEFSNGFVYEGSWVGDVRHGLGKYIFPSGHVYVGEWRSDKRHGAGQLTIAPSGDVYKGTWSEGKMHGSFVVERHTDWQELPPQPSSSDSGKQQPTNSPFTGPMRKIYEGVWEQGVPTKSGVFHIYAPINNGPSSAAAVTIQGEWDASQATKKSDGTIETPLTEHWRAIALLTQLSNLGKRPNHLLSMMDHVFDGMSNRPLLDFYDAELQSFMPSASMQNERMLRLKRYSELIPKLESALESTSKGGVDSNSSSTSGGPSEEDIQHTISSIESEANTKMAQHTDMESEAASLDLQAAQVNDASRDLKKKIDDISRQKEELKSLKSNAAKLESQVAAVEREIATLTSKCTTLSNDDIPKAKSDQEEVREDCDSNVAPLKASKSGILQSAKKDLAELDASLKAATKKANDAASKAREAKTAVDGAVQKLNAQLAVLSKQVADTEKQRTLKQKKSAEEIKKKQDQDAAVVQQCRNELSRLQALHETTRATLEEAKRQLDESKNRLQTEHNSDDINARDAQLEQLRQSNLSETNLLHEADAQVQLLQDDLVELRRAELQQEQANAAAALTRRQVAITSLESKIRQQETGNSIIAGEVTELDGQIRTLIAERTTLKGELEKLLAERAQFRNPTSPKKKKRDSSVTSPKTRKSSSPSVEQSNAEGSTVATQGPVIAGRLRRGNSAVLQQAARDTNGEGVYGEDDQGQPSTSATSHADTVAELEKRVNTVQRQNDEDEILIERLLREKKSHEEAIRLLNEAFTSRAVKEAAGMFSANHGAAVSLDLSEAGKEAVRHQLIKARSKQSALLKDQDRLHSQVAAAEETIQGLKRERQEGSQQSIATIIAGLRPEDWRLTYLVEQIEAKGKLIGELEPQTQSIPILEEQLLSFKETLSALQSKAQSSSGMGISSRRPAPF